MPLFFLLPRTSWISAHFFFQAVVESNNTNLDGTRIFSFQSAVLSFGKLSKRFI